MEQSINLEKDQTYLWRSYIKDGQMEIKDEVTRGKKIEGDIINTLNKNLPKTT